MNSDATVQPLVQSALGGILQPPLGRRSGHVIAELPCFSHHNGWTFFQVGAVEQLASLVLRPGAENFGDQVFGWRWRDMPAKKKEGKC